MQPSHLLCLQQKVTSKTQSQITTIEHKFIVAVALFNLRRFRYNLIYVFRWCPFVTVTKTQKNIARDGVSNTTCLKSGASVISRDQRQLLLANSKHRCSASEWSGGAQQQPATPVSVDNRRVEMAQLVSFDDNENTNADADLDY